MSLGRIEELVLARYGISVAVLGQSALERAVGRRIKTLGLRPGAIEEYSELVHGNDEERQQLLELLVVPETWFFRDEHVWPYLVRHVTQTWMPAHPGRPLRVLSAACATGEEPYSIVMALTDAGVPEGRLEVEALDVSQNSLDRAKAAVYGRNSFRSERVLPSISHHLVARDKGFHQVKESITRRVHFAQINLISPTVGASLRHSTYDIIFCRNVIIYFPREVQRKVLTAIHGLLAPDGVYFAGHSEFAPQLAPGYVPTGAKMTFSFRKARPEDRIETSPDNALNQFALAQAAALQPAFAPMSPPPAFNPAPAIAAPAAQPPAIPGAARRDARKPAPKAEPQDAQVQQQAAHADQGIEYSLAAARYAANQGDLERAAAICEGLAGVVASARRRTDEAEQYLRGAIFLSPRHSEALTHLALLLEERSDPQAAPMRRRAERALENEARQRGIPS
jgi:chemotaxis protein methyltransferase WspC